ncbi:MAG: acyltransferase [Prevotellaceae bacterium]|nr:acyltransferase [Prevotella sp.]MDD7256839.1 acyltransferase [Prevotellaceae bacterium]MDY6131586.1 acyltransferase [Prevotella sp.]
MTKDLLSLAESKALRGIAILGIVLHNYCHFLGFAVKENEYTFHADKPMQLWDKCLALDKDFFVHLLSFFGHYGVPVFLFISGFGLVAKYEKGGAEEVPTVAFVRYHFLKLFRLMFIGYGVFVAVYFMRANDGWEVYAWDKVLAQLTMTANIVFAEPNRIIKPGPYWYFGLMLQLYIVYRLLFYRHRTPGVLLAMMAGCWMLQVAATVWNPFETDLLNYLRYNFVGGILPFGLGILYARHARMQGKTFHTLMAAVSAVAVFAGSFTLHTWFWVPLFVTTGAVAIVKLLPQGVLSACAWMGGVSSALFVMHPVMREVIIGHYRRFDIYTGIAVYLLAAVSLSLLLQHVLKFVPGPQLKKNR